MPIDQNVANLLRMLDIDPAKAIEGISAKDIKKAYRKKIKKCHPDQGGNEEEFLRVVHAYRMLTDPEYVQRQKVAANPVHNLDATVTVGCSFDDAFFGRTITVTFVPVEVDDKGAIINQLNKMDEIEVEPEVLVVTLPPGSTNGFETTFHGKGVKCLSWAGNLRVQVVAQKHPSMMVKPRGGFDNVQDVYCVMPVPLDMMLRGGELEVLTMYGIKTVWVPPGSQPNAQLRIKNCGVSNIGDHVVMLQPMFPNQQDLKGETWQDLKIRWEEQEAHEKAIAAEAAEQQRDFYWTVRFGPKFEK